MTIRNALASLAVRDHAAAVAWYARLFGRPPDARPLSKLAEWHFPAGGWLQIYELAERAGGGSVTLAVPRLDAQLHVLQQLGIDPGAPILNEVVRVFMIKDPDGNRLAFAEALDPGL